MNTLTKLAVASLVVAAPSLVHAQKPGKVHTPIHVVKPHSIVPKTVPKTPRNDAAEDAAKRADKIADKTEKAEERNALRATLTPQQQSIFDANVLKFSKPKL